MIAELQNMVGAGAFRIVPDATDWPANQALHAPATAVPSSRSAQDVVFRRRTTAFGCCWSKPALMRRPSLSRPVSMPRSDEAADKLQKLILGELHHRIKNTLATVSAIASQSFRAAPSIEHGQKAMEGRLMRWDEPTTC